MLSVDTSKDAGHAKDSVIEDFASRLRLQIARHEIPPRARLREQDIATELGISRSRVQEVFSMLEARGLIERVPNKGAVVSRLELTQVAQIYDTREVLEGLGVRLATESAPSGTWTDLIEFFEGAMAAYVEEDDFDAFVEGYELFRTRDLDAADNPFLAEMLSNIYEKTQIVIRRTVTLPGRAATGLNEHRAVLNAMQQGGSALAERLRRQSIRSAKASFQRHGNFAL